MFNLLLRKPYWSSWFELRDKKLLVAFSGGKDSLALLDYAYCYKNTMNWSIGACHVNHLLRGDESYRDMHYCENWCKNREIDFHCKIIDVASSSHAERGIEHAARVLRYEALREVKKQYNYDYILTAHTADDQVESFFVDLYTGASIYTLGGIRTKNSDIIRPIKYVTGEMVVDYLKHRELTPVFDSSNNNKNYVRNSLRSDIIPVLAGYDKTVLNTVRRLQQESAELSDWLDEITTGAAYFEDECLVIRRDIFNNYAVPQKKFLIGKWISILCRGGKVHLDEIYNLLENGKSLRISLPNKFLCEITPYKIRLFPSNMTEPFCIIKTSGVCEITVNNKRIVFPDEIKDEVFIVRNRKNGDRFKGKSLKKIFSDMKLDLFYRDRAIILEKDDEIFWVEYLKSDNDIKIIANLIEYTM